jgi:hypothetical protein
MKAFETQVGIKCSRKTPCRFQAAFQTPLNNLRPFVAALGDWVEFIFVPVPKPIVIYADHDEHTTFCASSKSNLNRVVDDLVANDFERVVDYERPF